MASGDRKCMNGSTSPAETIAPGDFRTAFNHQCIDALVAQRGKGCYQVPVAVCRPTHIEKRHAKPRQRFVFFVAFRHFSQNPQRHIVRGPHQCGLERNVEPHVNNNPDR